MNDITFVLLKIVISICAALVTAYIIQYIKTLKTDRRYAGMLDMIDIAVRAAEQQIGSGCGERKKERVMEFVHDWLTRQGVKITKEQLSELIEAAVFNMNQEKK